MPGSKNDFLRFQIGRMETRPEQIAIYENRRVTGYEKGETLMSTFRLLGCGSTLEKAEKMAGTV